MATTITVKGTEIQILRQEQEDFISLTDMLKAKDGDFFISDWLRNRNTVEFLGIWETVHNPNFNYGEFAIIRSQAGLNNYKISVKEWVEKTSAIGIKATAGRYGGTYAHKDIAFEFGMWISAEFKIYLIKEFQRLKEQELKQLGWDIRRNLAKINYRIHTDAIKENLIPPELTARQINLIYAGSGRAEYGSVRQNREGMARQPSRREGQYSRLREHVAACLPFQFGKSQCALHSRKNAASRTAAQVESDRHPTNAPADRRQENQATGSGREIMEAHETQKRLISAGASPDSND